MNRRLQRGVIILPSALTLANLFLGIWAIISASRGRFETAAWLIVLAAVADMIDGRVARITQTGTRFGAELDSLVDAISFGVAPALIVYHVFLDQTASAWMAIFIYIAGAVIRLARFNIQQAGEAKMNFHGLPSPTAGVTLATFYPFAQTEVFAQLFGRPPLVDVAIGLLLGLSALMMSHVLYPVVPKFGFRSWKGRITLLIMLLSVVAAFTVPELYFFPMAALYISYGLVKALLLGFFERLPDHDLLLDEEEVDEADAEMRDIDYDELEPPQRGWRPRRRRRRASDRHEPPRSDE